MSKQPLARVSAGGRRRNLVVTSPSTLKAKFTIHPNLFHKVLAGYPNTFTAFCELINNSIHAGATEIRIVVSDDFLEGFEDTTKRFISIVDNGVGVAKSEFEQKIFKVAHGMKKNGHGIGRFAAFQIGSSVEIETVAKDKADNQVHKIYLPLNVAELEKALGDDEQSINVPNEVVEGSSQSYYKVTVRNFYPSSVVKKEPKKKLDKALSSGSIKSAIFERYADFVFTEKVKFYINESFLDPKDYVLGDVEKRTETYTDGDGVERSIEYKFYNVNAKGKGVRLFLMTDNAGIKTVSQGLNYRANIPSIHQWYIYANSPVIDEHSSIFRNFELSHLDPKSAHLFEGIRKHVDKFFQEKYKDYHDFVGRLEDDPFYPYREHKSTSMTKQAVFHQLAYLVEEEYKLLNSKNNIRKVVYNLLDCSLETGDIEALVDKVIGLKPETVSVFKQLVKRADLSDVIHFSDDIAKKQNFLDFLHHIIYGSPAKYIGERKQLHKMVEKNLWIFGEQYGPKSELYSDKNLENSLRKLRDRFFIGGPSEEDGGVIDVADPELRDIADLFFFNERPIDGRTREVLLVELKAPTVRISQKELNQIDRYAVQILENGEFPSNVRFKLILISSDLTVFAKHLIGTQDKTRPELYKSLGDGLIDIYVLKWSDLIRTNKEKLSHLGDVLRTHDLDILQYVKETFPDVKDLESSLMCTPIKTPTARAKPAKAKKRA